MITVVTAYFNLSQSKFNHEQYIKWIENFMQIKSNVIIFTDTDLLEYRPKDLWDKTYIVKTTFNNFLTKKYNWEKHYAMDHEKYHNIYLYMIWNEKSNFLKRAIDLNPFESEYFYWTDIGAFREKPIPEYPKRCVDKIILLNIMPFKQEELKEGIDNRFQYVNRIGGGIFGGHKNNCLIWCEKYYQMLDLFFEKNIFAGKDQSIMAFVYINNPQLCEVVFAPNKWFYLEEYLTFLDQGRKIPLYRN